MPMKYAEKSMLQSYVITRSIIITYLVYYNIFS